MISKMNIYSIISAGLLFLSYSIFFFVADDNILILAGEDGIFETAGAIFFLISAILFLVIFFKNRNNDGQFILKNIFYLLLGCAFLLAFLEEISWGQRIFNLTTPEFLQEINAQEEINIHNIDIFHSSTEDGTRKTGLALWLNLDRLFSLFWFIYCCLLPLLYKFHYQTKKTLDRIYLPIVPIFMGLFFILNYLLSKMIEFQVNTLLHDSIVEIKESNIAFLFFVVSIWFYKRSKNNMHTNVI